MKFHEKGPPWLRACLGVLTY